MKRNLHTLQCARVLGRPNLRTLQCARPFGYEPGSKWLSTGFEDFRPLAGPGPESGSKWLVLVMVLKIFGPWLAQDQKVAPNG